MKMEIGDAVPLWVIHSFGPSRPSTYYVDAVGDAGQFHITWTTEISKARFFTSDSEADLVFRNVLRDALARKSDGEVIELQKYNFAFEDGRRLK
jgi:hypothetical protein